MILIINSIDIITHYSYNCKFFSINPNSYLIECDFTSAVPILYALSYIDIMELSEVIYIKQYSQFNLSDLQHLGTGTQGSVYRIDKTKCIKIFNKEKYCQAELHSLLISQIDVHFPKLYSYGDNYIIREYIKGISIDSYLSNHTLTNEICSKIIEIYNAMYFVGFKRLDSALFHIFLVDSDINPPSKVMLIDTAKAMKKTYSYPKIMLKSLERFKSKEKFLLYVKNNHPELYSKWHP